MRLVQYRESGGHRAVAVLDRAPPAEARRVQDAENTYELALEAMETGKSLVETVRAHGTDAAIDLDQVGRDGRLLPPLEHPVPTRCWITGSECTPRGGSEDGSADAKAAAWFFRGNGATLVGSGLPLHQPEFGLGAAQRPAVVGLYVIADDGTPCRLGWALGNDFTDDRLQGLGPGHAAQARLRASAVGPELLFGDLPREVSGTARLRRGNQVVEEIPFAAGQAQLAQSVATLEANHFRYPMFRRPGDVHLHFLVGGQPAGTGMGAEPGDVFEITTPAFWLTLANPLAAANWPAPKIRVL
jgi:hypothetical protein